MSDVWVRMMWFRMMWVCQTLLCYLSHGCVQINNEVKLARKELKKAQSIMQLDELKCRKRVLRRYISSSVPNIIFTTSLVPTSPVSTHHLLFPPPHHLPSSHLHHITSPLPPCLCSFPLGIHFFNPFCFAGVVNITVLRSPGLAMPMRQT